MPRKATKTENVAGGSASPVDVVRNPSRSKECIRLIPSSRFLLSASWFSDLIRPQFSSPSCYVPVSIPPHRVCLLGTRNRVSNNSILVADDETDVVDLISQNLRTAGFQVSNAIDGTSALS